jgi:hypothetical protein
MNIRSLVTRSLFVLCLLVASSEAHADTITFDPLQLTGSGFTHMDSYTEAGFTFTSVNNPGDAFAFASAQQNNLAYYAGSAGLAVNNFNDFGRLTAAGGAAFSLTSIDLSHFMRGSNGVPVVVTFTGNYVGGGTTVQSFTVTIFGFQTFNFDPSFTNLSSVEFGPTSARPFYQFDNVVVNQSLTAVPEPTTMALLGAGLVGVAAKVRRRSAKARL